MTTDEKLDRLTLLMEHLAEDVQDIKSDLKEFRTENVKEHEVLYNQIAGSNDGDSVYDNREKSRYGN